jgi:hypothetical protein
MVKPSTVIFYHFDTLFLHIHFGLIVFLIVFQLKHIHLLLIKYLIIRHHKSTCSSKYLN